MAVQILTGDALAVLTTLPDASVDAVVTDPPYGLSFMGKRWDYDVPSVAVWSECLRVLKPGGHLLAFAGTRTQHRMAVRIEDAGFEIRDMLAWIYGSGFPKSKNLAGDWQGWGTALKPAMEPITLARKPLTGTVAANVLQHGCGALNIDGCRIESEVITGWGGGGSKLYEGGLSRQGGVARPSNGRWPANVCHDGSDEVVALFPEAPGQLAPIKGTEPSLPAKGDVAYGFRDRVAFANRADGGGSAARFFYAAKASRHDRNEGLEGMPGRPLLWSSGTQSPGTFQSPNTHRAARNHHPTVKPTELMRWLVRLVTPPGGVVLDPFCGSGSTLKAAEIEGFEAIGIEIDPGYVEIARRRVAADAPLFSEVTAA